MVSNYQAYKFIASILSYKSDPDMLKSLITNPDFDWEIIVKISSRHLILPTLYIRLKEKSLLSEIPIDLKEYLEELTSINRNRNISLLKDVNEISELFQTHNINHVFLKGTALLAARYYSDLGERMIGDIDILVDNKDIKKAYQLLIENNFEATQETNLHNYIDHKHLPRLIPNEGLAAVELHKRLFDSKKINVLQPETILNSKQLINRIYVPSSSHLLQHSVLNWQINDKGFYFSKIGFRNAFDSLTILNIHPEISILDEIKNTYTKQYYHILSLFFDEIEPKLFNENGLKLNFLRFKYKNQKLSNLIDLLLNKLLLLNTLFKRFYMFIGNKNYRTDVIADKKRIIKILRNKDSN